jgi:hypothetical protein
VSAPVPGKDRARDIFDAQYPLEACVYNLYKETQVEEDPFICWISPYFFILKVVPMLLSYKFDSFVRFDVSTIWPVVLESKRTAFSSPCCHLSAV